MIKRVIFIVAILSIFFSCSYIGLRKDDMQRVIVTFQNNEWLETAIRTINIEGISIISKLDLISGVTCYMTERQQKWLKKVLPVRYIEKDTQVYILAPIPRPAATTVSEDVPGQELVDWGVKRIRAPEVWSQSTGKGIGIGVIDTGICSSHPDLIGAVVGGYNTITGGGSYEDDNDHGTYVASVIAARRNGVGIIGVAPDAVLYSIKVLDSSGQGWMSDIVKGYQWALEEHERNEKFNLVNLSLGCYWESEAMLEAMTKAAYQGMGTVAATGNDGREEICYPARNEVAICVGASSMEGERVSWSNYGKELKKNGVLAPGEWILAANKLGGWQRVSGTSIATPHVTGALALLLEMKWAERKFIFAGAGQSSTPDLEHGYGIIDVRRSLDVMMGE